jgi:hypothetical protein
MSEQEQKSSANDSVFGKPVEKRGFPPPPPVLRPPANQDLRFVVNETFRLVVRFLSEIDKVIKILKE